MSLPIATMLRDADRADSLQAERLGPDMLLGDLSCHVRALAAEVERLEAERDAWAGRCRSLVLEDFLLDGIPEEKAAELADAWMAEPPDPEEGGAA